MSRTSNLKHTICSVGRPKHVRAMTGAVEGDQFVGSKAQQLRGLLSIHYPIGTQLTDAIESRKRFST